MSSRSSCKTDIELTYPIKERFMLIKFKLMDGDKHNLNYEEHILIHLKFSIVGYDEPPTTST